MKKTILLFFCLNIFIHLSFGQSPCNNPISSYQFQSLKSRLQNQTTMSARLSTALNSIRGNCFTSVQVKEILLMFSQDHEKLEFAKAAYANTFDKVNFYDVYDAFAYFSSVFRLHDYTKQDKASIVTPPPTTITPKPNLKFALLLYPSPEGYTGKKNCISLLAESDFMFLARQVHQAGNESAKMSKAMQTVRTNCLSVAQTMKLASLLELEENRLHLLKMAYPKTYDVEHYAEAHQLFQHFPNQEALENFIRSKNVDVGGTTGDCTINDSEMKQVLNSIENENFASSRKMLAKQILQSKKCFTAVQVSQIASIFGFDSDKLEIAKFAYDYTTDQDNYHILNSIFSFDSNKKELMKYVNSKK